MLRSCGRLFRSRSLSQWHVRSISTVKKASLEEKDGKRHTVSKPDGDQHEPVIAPKRRGRPRKSPPEDASTSADNKTKEGKTCKRTTAKTVNSRTTKPKPRNAQLPDAPSADVAAPSSSKLKPKPKPNPKSSALPLHLVSEGTSKHHHDLSSFLVHAALTNLKTTTSFYKGTHYEYTVASTLSQYHMTLHRSGRSNDLGIDLIGHWTLPPPSRHQKAAELRVLVQCKASQPQPSLVRELEGAYAGAPAGWRGEGVLALLVASTEATKGVREAVQRSRWPVGVMLVTREGELRQFLWNAEAARIGLEGLGVLVRYKDGRGKRTVQEEDANGNEDADVKKSGERAKGSLGLTWMGKPWRNGNVTNIFDFRSAKTPRLRQTAASFAVFSVTGCMSANFHDYVYVGINVVEEAPDMKPVDKKLTDDAAAHLNNKSNEDGDRWRKAC